MRWIDRLGVLALPVGAAMMADVERTLAGVPRRTVTFETGDHADCHVLDGSRIHEGDELVVIGLAWLDGRTLSYPFAWRQRVDGRWDLSVVAPDNRRRLPADLRSTDTYAEILAFIGRALPPTDAEPASSEPTAPTGWVLMLAGLAGASVFVIHQGRRAIRA